MKILILFLGLAVSLFGYISAPVDLKSDIIKKLYSGEDYLANAKDFFWLTNCKKLAFIINYDNRIMLDEHSIDLFTENVFKANFWKNITFKESKQALESHGLDGLISFYITLKKYDESPNFIYGHVEMTFNPSAECTTKNICHKPYIYTSEVAGEKFNINQQIKNVISPMIEDFASRYYELIEHKKDIEDYINSDKK